MRPPARIKPWLSSRQMQQWLKTAGSKAEYQRGLAVLLTSTQGLYAHQVAKLLGVSTPAVWLWISKYNTYGPDGLEDMGRGGRRWAFLSQEKEEEILRLAQQKTATTNSSPTRLVRQTVEEHLGKKVSLSYVYRLMKRHGWLGKAAGSKQPATPTEEKEALNKYYRPWLRLE